MKKEEAQNLAERLQKEGHVPGRYILKVQTVGWQKANCPEADIQYEIVIR